MRQASRQEVSGGVAGRGLRFLSVSIVNVPLVQLLIFVLQLLAGLEGWLANFIAVVVLTGPAYLLSVKWVWGHSGEIGKAPVVWFWILSVGGLLTSTAAVYALSEFIDGIWVANAASLATYGAIFAVRFLVLDTLLHRREPG